MLFLQAIEFYKKVKKICGKSVGYGTWLRNVAKKFARLLHVPTKVGEMEAPVPGFLARNTVTIVHRIRGHFLKILTGVDSSQSVV